jgi:hypothetical protein
MGRLRAGGERRDRRIARGKAARPQQARSARAPAAIPQRVLVPAMQSN